MPLCYVDSLAMIIVCPNPCVGSPMKMICRLDVMSTSFTVIYAPLQKKEEVNQGENIYSFYIFLVLGGETRFAYMFYSYLFRKLFILC